MHPRFRHLQVPLDFTEKNIAAAEPGGELSSIAIRCGRGTDELMATVVTTAGSDKRLRSGVTGPPKGAAAPARRTAASERSDTGVVRGVRM